MDKCPHCGSEKFKEEPIFELFNKKGEYVEGYGHNAVFIQSKTKKNCVGCGWNPNGNPTVIKLPEVKGK